MSEMIDKKETIDMILGQPPELHYPVWYAGQIRSMTPAQPKRGKWIFHIDDLFPEESTQECDQCHEEQPLACDSNYCPYCGANMEVTE